MGLLNNLRSWWRGGSPSAEQVSAGDFYDYPLSVLSPVESDERRDQMRADAFPPPYTGPNDLDDYGRETETMRRAYRDLHRKEPNVRAAIRGKVAAVAALDVSVTPDNPDDDRECKAAEFVKWTVGKTLHGWDGLITRIVEPALIDGFSVCEKTLRAHDDSRKWYGAWGLKHVKNRDTAQLSLRLDAYRNILGVVSRVRGLRTHLPEKVIVFTHADMYDNPFGSSDLRAAYRSANLIDKAYELWYTAVKIYGAPFLTGRVSDSLRQQQMSNALKAARAGGYAVCPVEDEIDVLNMASATSFTAFEAKVNKHREEIFLAVRGAYLPFLEGQNNDAAGDNAVHKVASDALEYLLAKAVGRCLSQQLVPDLVQPNFGDHISLTVTLGGVNWAETKQQLEVAEKVMERAPISKKWLYEVTNVPPPEDDSDAIGGPPPAGPPGTPGQAPGGDPANPLAPPGVPGSPRAPGVPGQPGGPPAAETMNAADADKPAGPAFGKDLARRYADYFAPDRHGRYAGNMHEQFGLNPAEFADASGLMRKATGKGDRQTWVWAPKAAVVPVAKIGTDPQRLQFRPYDGDDGLTESRRPKSGETFDPATAPPVALWKDPRSGQDLVVDGHKRIAAAKAAGVPSVRAVYIQASTAEQAKAIGAEMNADQTAKKPEA